MEVFIVPRVVGKHIQFQDEDGSAELTNGMQTSRTFWAIELEIWCVVGVSLLRSWNRFLEIFDNGQDQLLHKFLIFHDFK